MDINTHVLCELTVVLSLPSVAIVVRLDCFYRYLPGKLSLLPVVLPGLLRLKLLKPDRLRLVVRLVPRQIGMLVVPNLCRRLSLSEKQPIRLDARIGIKHTIRQPNDRRQIALLQPLFP